MNPYWHMSSFLSSYEAQVIVSPTWNQSNLSDALQGKSKDFYVSSFAENCLFHWKANQRNLTLFVVPIVMKPRKTDHLLSPCLAKYCIGLRYTSDEAQLTM